MSPTTPAPSAERTTARSGVAGPAPRPRRTRVLALPEARWAAGSLAAFLLALVFHWAGAPAWSWGALYAVCYAAGGWEPAWAGLCALREKTLDVDLLMIVAAIGAASIGQVMDGGLLIVIFATSGALEALATARTEDSVRGLLDLAPTRATRIGEAGDETIVPTEELRVGDTILVRPGERIGADGTVLDGASEVDQATITGEPLPAAKERGDEVFAGTLNGTGALTVTVGRDASETVIARIVAMVAEASRTKAPTQLFIEKVEQRYSVGVVVATLALFALPLAFGAELTATLLRAMTFMIVASPCAVVLATMPPLLSAIANAGRHGVLVKSAVVMERLAEVDAVAMDKTGTLTEGAPRVADIRVLASGPTENEVLALAAAAEHASEHPLGRAVVEAARVRGLRIQPATDFASEPGRGVSAVVDGRRVEIGRAGFFGGEVRLRCAEPLSTVDRARSLVPRDLRAFSFSTATAPLRLTRRPGTEDPGRPSAVEGAADAMPTQGAPAPAVEVDAAVAELEDAGRTAVVVRVDGALVAVLGIADRLRDGAPGAIAALHRLTGAVPMLLTGDNARAAARVAGEAGIADVRAGLLPQDKVAAVRELEAAGRKVLVVGDGVNDAPALAAAHAGIAMGRAGSDLALETADAVVVRDELAAVPGVVALARRARRLVIQNLVIASLCITALVVWDLAGTLPLPLGVAGHEGSTVIVGLNGLRLLREAAWRRGV